MDMDSTHVAGPQRLTARFEGRVQGVGFRYTAVDVAARLGLTGYVSNLPDGAVELVAEGSADKLGELLSGLQRSHLGRYILHVYQRWTRATGEFPDFTIQ